MSEKMSKEERRAKYRELFAHVPGCTYSEKIEWIAERTGATAQTVRTYMAVSANPMPAAKLSVLQIELARHLAQVAAQLGQQ